MIEIYKQFKAPYVGTWLFWKPALIINSPEIAKNVLIKDFAYFRNRFLSSGTSDPIGGLHLFSVNDPLWSSLRRRLTTPFTSAKLKLMQPLINVKAKELMQRIKNTEDRTKISLQTLFVDYTTDIFAAAAFGVKTNATLTGKDPMRTVTAALAEFDLYRGINWITIFFLPQLVDVFRFTYFPKRATDYFKKVFDMVSQQRLKNRGSVEYNDLLDVLLRIKEDAAKNNENISDDTILAQAVIFLFGGTDTSASAFTYAVYELSYRQDLQRLRKYPPMGWIDRVAGMDYKVDDNLTISKGTPVYVNAIGMHYDNDLFPDAKTFNPDRFLPENEKDITPFSYLPFGEGPRNCIGLRFGQISIRQGLANLILNYKLLPLPGAPKPNEVEFEKYGLLLVAGPHFHIDFVERN